MNAVRIETAVLFFISTALTCVIVLATLPANATRTDAARGEIVQQSATATATDSFTVPAETPVMPAIPTATRGPFATATAVLPWDGKYFDVPDADIAQDIADSYAESTGSGVVVNAFAEVDELHATALGLPVDQIEYGDATDLAIVMTGAFTPQMSGSSSTPPAPHILVVLDRRQGVYSEEFSFDLQTLLQKLQP